MDARPLWPGTKKLTILLFSVMKEHFSPQPYYSTMAYQADLKFADTAFATSRTSFSLSWMSIISAIDEALATVRLTEPPQWSVKQASWVNYEAVLWLACWSSAVRLIMSCCFSPSAFGLVLWHRLPSFTATVPVLVSNSSTRECLSETNSLFSEVYARLPQ